MMKYLNKHKILNLFISTSPFLLLAIKSYPEIGLDGFHLIQDGINFFIIFFFLFLNNNLDININLKIFKALAFVLVLIVASILCKGHIIQSLLFNTRTPISNFEMNFNVSQNCRLASRSLLIKI